jgi:glucose/arabinose dehydrogenase
MHVYDIRPGSILFAIGCAAIGAQAALTWPGCADLTDADFKVTTLVSRSADAIEEPMKMAFDLLAQPGEDAKGKVDVYFTQRYGAIRKYDSRQGKTITLGTLNLTIGAGSSDGLMGIALDPLFKSNHFIYVYYTFKSASESSWRVSRFTLDAANTHLDSASEKALLGISIKIGSQHPGGALQFDAYGDLWITTGNDMSGSDAYLRGKVLRIHPNADGSYSNPSGNLFPAGKYPAGKTRPEIYVMGTRNPYTLSLDPVRRWAVWGDVGPDDFDMDGKAINGANSATDKTEEYDLATVPGNYGYPFFAGAKAMKTGIDAAKPVIPAGANWNGYAPGLDTLPPAIAPIFPFSRSCAVTGPIYRYDGDLNSSIKMPPHFNRKWFVTDFNGQNKVQAVTVSEDGRTKITQEPVFTKIALNAPLDFQAGPDGAFYIVSYAGYRTVTASTGIIRIDYMGACRPALPKLETSTFVNGNSEMAGHGPQVALLPGREFSIEVKSTGVFALRLLDLSGRLLAFRTGTGNMRIVLGEVRPVGVCILAVSGPEGSRTMRILNHFVN